jgi:cyanophycinase
MKVETCSDQTTLPVDNPDVLRSAEQKPEVICGKTESTSRGQTGDGAGSSPKGALVMAGGGLRYDNADVWSRFVQLAADYARESGEPEGTPPRIAIFPTAALFPQQTGSRVVAVLERYGADAFVIPIAIKNCELDAREAVRDPAIVAQIRSAHGVFFTGGQQARITDALRMDNGGDTPALEAIWHVYREGGVVGGSSAGTAVMSRIMCRAVESQLAILESGVTPGRDTSEGLGFLDKNWFVDQHFIIRARFARALAVSQHHGFLHGLGVDENTALLVRHGETEIVGYRGAIYLDLSEARHDPTADGFNVKNARVSYLDRGDRLNMETLVLTPSPEKQAEPVIDPNSPGFEPELDEPIFTTDILGNSTLLDVMRRLMNNRLSHATGLAFDGSAAGRGRVPAFEFRLYRDKDTRAWPPGAGEDFTIANVHLDVRRVEVARLSYK